MLERENDYYCMKDDVLVDKRTGQEVLPSAPKPLFGTYDAFYFDGYRAYLSCRAKILLKPAGLSISAGDSKYGWSKNLNYTEIESLNITHERETTGLRTFLIGPLWAAVFKKETRLITIGFRDDLGMLQTPSFKILHSEPLSETPTEVTMQCYDTILQKIRESKATSMDEHAN